MKNLPKLICLIYLSFNSYPSNAQPDGRTVYFSTSGYISDCLLTIINPSPFQQFVTVQTKFTDATVDVSGGTVTTTSGATSSTAPSTVTINASTTTKILILSNTAAFRTIFGSISVDDIDKSKSGWVIANGKCFRPNDLSTYNTNLPLQNPTHSSYLGAINLPDYSDTSVYNFIINAGRSF